MRRVLPESLTNHFFPDISIQIHFLAAFNAKSALQELPFYSGRCFLKRSYANPWKCKCVDIERRHGHCGFMAERISYSVFYANNFRKKQENLYYKENFLVSSSFLLPILVESV